MPRISVAMDLSSTQAGRIFVGRFLLLRHSPSGALLTNLIEDSLVGAREL